MESKRVHFTCDESAYDKLESLKHLLGKKRDEILEDAINDRFRDVIARIATSEGLLTTTTHIELNRSDFADNASSSVFDAICKKLNLSAADGKISTIDAIQFEIKSALVTQP